MTDRQRGRKAMIWSVVILHVWGTILVWAVYKGSTSSAIPDMFASICLGIGATLAVIAGDKGLMEFVQGRNVPRQETETTTKTVTNEAPKID